jgi:hypothetical protein
MENMETVVFSLMMMGGLVPRVELVVVRLEGEDGLLDLVGGCVVCGLTDLLQLLVYLFGQGPVVTFICCVKNVLLVVDLLKSKDSRGVHSGYIVFQSPDVEINGIDAGSTVAVSVITHIIVYGI